MPFVIDDLMVAAAVASMLASAGGTVAQMGAQSKIRKQQGAAQQAEAARQRDIDRRRDLEMQQALPEHTVEKQGEKQDSIANQLTQYMTPTVDTSTEYLADSGAPQEVKDAMSRQLVGALAKGKDYAKNMANVSSYSRLNLDNKLGMNRLGERVGMLNQESQRSSGILPMELDDANLAGVGLNTAATAMNGVGGIADAVMGYKLMTKGVGGAGKALPKGSALPLNANIG